MDMHIYRGEDEDPPRVVRGELSLSQRLDLKQSGSRIGDDQREQAQAHLSAMYASGHLSAEVAEIRRGLIAAAETRQEITLIMDDLPPYPKPEPTGFDWDNKRHFIPALAAGIGAGLLLASLPAACLSAAHMANGSAATAVIVISIVLGIMLAIASAATLVTKLVD